eukprot:Opistho-2@66993
MSQALELWYSDPGVSISVLRLVEELVQNRNNRLNFDVSSPNAFLLFREASKVIVTYGQRVITLTPPPDLIYQQKYKGIKLCFSILRHALAGNYVNFGVFRLYGDDALDVALRMFVEMLRVIPIDDILVYRKVALVYYPLIETLSTDHMHFIASLEPTVFQYVMASVSEGLCSFDTEVQSHCYFIVDNIVTHYFKSMTRPRNGGGESRVLAERFAQFPSILPSILSHLLRTVMYDEAQKQLVARPLLPLILVEEKFFNEWKANEIASRPADRQQLLQKFFDDLMGDIERNLQQRNRDRFMQRVNTFKHDVSMISRPTAGKSGEAFDVLL